jgi:hypothetical protein
MKKIELDAHRKQIEADLARMVEIYCAVFDWDAAKIDQRLAHAPVLTETYNASDDLEKGLSA